MEAKLPPNMASKNAFCDKDETAYKLFLRLYVVYPVSLCCNVRSQLFWHLPYCANICNNEQRKATDS
eukprot:276936-Pleurochrysis_carterae.AAC.5